MTLHKDYEGYTFPMTPEHMELGLDLLAILEEGSELAVLALHEFVKPFLLAVPFTGDMEEYSKWSDPMECLLAVHFVQQDGNFRQPKDVTQTFAHLSYHIRGAMLYEAYQLKGQFNNDLAK